MKRFIILAALLLVPGLLNAGVTQTFEQVSGHVYCITMTVTFSASGGGLESTPTDWDINGLLLAVETDPGATAPTDDYDLYLYNDRGRDVMGGALLNRDTANTEITEPYIDSQYVTVPVQGKLWLQVANQAVNSAIVVIKIFFMR